MIDKDLTSSLLARELEADMLVMLTDVPGVAVDWSQPSQRFIRSASPEDLRALEFAPGSMDPKVEAACRFVEATKRPAAIGALSDAVGVVDGAVGNIVRHGEVSVTYQETFDRCPRDLSRLLPFGTNNRGHSALPCPRHQADAG